MSTVTPPATATQEQAGRNTPMTLTVHLGDIGEEEPDTIELEPLPEEAPAPTPEPVPA